MAPTVDQLRQTTPAQQQPLLEQKRAFLAKHPAPRRANLEEANPNGAVAGDVAIIPGGSSGTAAGPTLGKCWAGKHVGERLDRRVDVGAQLGGDDFHSFRGNSRWAARHVPFRLLFVAVGAGGDVRRWRCGASALAEALAGALAGALAAALAGAK